MAVMNFSSLLTGSSFRAQAHEFVTTLEKAAVAAGESDRRYEVIIRLREQKYILREITTPELSQVLEEEIILENDFGSNCRVDYVQFDDGEYTNDEGAVFRAGRSGFQYGGKVVLVDSGQKVYSVVVNRLNRTVALVEGDVAILAPRGAEEMMF
jgi:hypothetical protein